MAYFTIVGGFRCAACREWRYTTQNYPALKNDTETLICSRCAEGLSFFLAVLRGDAEELDHED